MTQSNSLDTYLVDFKNFVGINDIIIPEKKINIYPNPAHDKAYVKIDIDKPDQVELKLFDMIGKEMLALSGKSLEQNNNLLEIDLGGLPQGIYLCRVLTSQTSYTKLIEKAW